MNRAALSIALLLLVACSETPSVGHSRKEAARSAQSGDDTRVQAAPDDAAQPLGLRPEYQRCVDTAAGVVPETQACIGAEFTYQEQRLKRVLDRKLSQPDATRVGAAQASWRKTTDARCAWNAAEQGQGQRLEANACELEAIAARADELSH